MTYDEANAKAKRMVCKAVPELNIIYNKRTDEIRIEDATIYDEKFEKNDVDVLDEVLAWVFYTGNDHF